MSGKIPVGEVRPSQLLWTYGPGALIDMPNLSVVTMGVDSWEEARCQPIDESRLLAAVRRALGPQVQRLMVPPVIQDERVDPFSPEAKIGVPVRPFPRWLRCVKCQLLAEFDSGLFDIKENPYRPEWTRFVHKNCGKAGGKDVDAVPARFLLACRNGHLDDFPWNWFVHGGPSECKGTLRFYEVGASLQTENLWVACDTCGAKRSMVYAFGERAKEYLPACRGRHPHLGRFDHDCDADPRAVLLGATNSWFPVTISALAIPLGKDPVMQLVRDGWEYFSDVESVEETKIVVKTLKKTNALMGIAEYEAEEIWEAIQDYREGTGEGVDVTETDMKVPEWEVLTSETPPNDWPHFMSRRVDSPKPFSEYFHSVVLIERLREVNALLGFTRVEAPEEMQDGADRPSMAPLSDGSPEWIPVSEVHGEGVFIRFDEKKISTWMTRDIVKERDVSMKRGHEGWRTARGLDPKIGYPGVRYALLHTFAHLLIREFALECGYNAASIRERIYALDPKDDGGPMAGVLLYTAAADSDGTLGGLVELGKPESLGPIIEQALKRARVCSSDPLCSEHMPEKDRSLHAASCHSCSFVSETSCEKGNRYLDRTLVVPTLKHSDAAFFMVDL